jgi:CheY-like chemotaxis protein
VTSKYRILFVEDNTDTCELMQVILDDAEVTCVYSYDHALLKINSEPAFDLLLIDYYLPDATGIELCEAIRSAGLQTPIVFLSGSGWLSHRDVRDAGGQGFVRKSNPNFIDEVKSVISTLLTSGTSEQSNLLKHASANH